MYIDCYIQVSLINTGVSSFREVVIEGSTIYSVIW